MRRVEKRIQMLKIWPGSSQRPMIVIKKWTHMIMSSLRKVKTHNQMIRVCKKMILRKEKKNLVLILTLTGKRVEKNVVERKL